MLKNEKEKDDKCPIEFFHKTQFETLKTPLNLYFLNRLLTVEAGPQQHLYPKTKKEFLTIYTRIQCYTDNFITLCFRDTARLWWFLEVDIPLINDKSVDKSVDKSGDKSGDKSYGKRFDNSQRAVVTGQKIHETRGKFRLTTNFKATYTNDNIIDLFISIAGEDDMGDHNIKKEKKQLPRVPLYNEKIIHKSVGQKNDYSSYSLSTTITFRPVINTMSQANVFLSILAGAATAVANLNTLTNK